MVARITTAHELSHLVQWPIQKSQLFNRHAAPKLVLQESMSEFARTASER